MGSEWTSFVAPKAKEWEDNFQNALWVNRLITTA